MAGRTDKIAPVQPLLLKVGEVCQLLRCGRDRVYDLINTGQLRSVTVGERGRRVLYADVVGLVDRLVEADQAERAS